MRKKMLALFLVLVFTLSLGATAFASSNVRCEAYRDGSNGVHAEMESYAPERCSLYISIQYLNNNKTVDTDSKSRSNTIGVSLNSDSSRYWDEAIVRFYKDGRFIERRTISK